MTRDLANTRDMLDVSILRGSKNLDAAESHGVYAVECRDAEGNLKWSDTIDNLWTTVGMNKVLDEALAGTSYTATWFMGLIGATGYSGAPAAGNTMASHSGWSEDVNYSESARPTMAFAAASSGSKAGSAVTFSINATTTIKGCFVNSVATKSGTTGTLFSAGLFSSGDKALSSGDTLSVSYTASLT